MELLGSHRFIPNQVPFCPLACENERLTVDGTFVHSVGNHGSRVEPIQPLDGAVLQVLANRDGMQQQLLVIGRIDGVCNDRVEDASGINDCACFRTLRP